MAQRPWLKDKTLLITGGTGSLGRALTRRILTETEAAKVIIFSRDEWKQWEMRQLDPLFDSSRIRYFIGNVRDEHRMRRAFRDVDYVVHAAALKQVPAAEYNPSEFVLTNVNGAQNVINAAIDCNVKKVVALSTDKAVNPINLYGATKLCSDKLFTHGNAYVGKHGCPKFSVARYGNVLGSRGSIIPFWKKMLDEGATSLPVTDPRMTRFWITLDQAADFVLECMERMFGGEIFVPKIPSMRIEDLAEAIAPDVPKEVVGIREGEKLHELMISADDSRRTIEFDKYYVILPETKHGDPFPEAFFRLGKPMGDDFSYTSDNNPEWITAEELHSLLKEHMEAVVARS
jgi:UDP-N-acetylglucosamine 4,6-dehydratase